MFTMIVKSVISGFRKIFKNTVECCLGLALFFSIFAGSYNAKNPSLGQIDSLWRALYGSPVHQGIVVFNKTRGGSGNESLDTLCIMRLVSEERKAIVKSLFHYKQYQTWGWGASSAYRISPDGSKIAMFNNTAVQVCDTNGTNIKVIRSVNLGCDQLALSWDDSAGVRRIVYSIGSKIIRTVINDNNTAGKTDTLWDYAWGKDPAQGNNVVYTSVNKVGKFVCFDMINTNYFVNLPVIVDLQSRTAKNPTNGGDGCQVRMLADGLGTIAYHENSHLKETTIWRWPSMKLESVSCPGGALDKCSDCGNNMHYWCDSDTNFMVQTGDNEQSVSPGCYTKAFIRKGRSTRFASSMYLGDYFAFPALWLDPNPLIPVEIVNHSVSANNQSRAVVTCNHQELTLSGVLIDKVTIFSLNGAVKTQKAGNVNGIMHFSLSRFHAGTYIVVWNQGYETFSQYISIPR
jgi:hypothetical protein